MKVYQGAMVQRYLLFSVSFGCRVAVFDSVPFTGPSIPLPFETAITSEKSPSSKTSENSISFPICSSAYSICSSTDPPRPTSKFAAFFEEIPVSCGCVCTRSLTSVILSKFSFTFSRLSRFPSFLEH